MGPCIADIFPSITNNMIHLLGLVDSPMCRGRGMEEETSAHILYECEALASLRHAYLASFFMEPRDIMSASLGLSVAMFEPRGSQDSDMGHKGPVN
jgi:hypothetical protein